MMIANWNRLLFEDCLRHVRECGRSGQPEDVLRWAWVSAWFASRKGWFGELSSRELETELLQVASRLPVPQRKHQTGSRPRWLHVLTEAYGTLGHTNLCRRWIQFDSNVIHDVILLDQRDDPPASLVAAATESGGELIRLDPMTSFIQRATELRDRAWNGADVAVLHVHPEDVIATAAFGVPGGPPVAYVNHADHAFWVGCAVADLVVDIRTSGQAWTRAARGVDRTAILPLPLVSVHTADGGTDREEKKRLRAALGLPANQIMFLTVGSAPKFEPMPGLDFVQTAVRLLKECPEAILIAVGPAQSGPWKAAWEATGGRVLALGRQPDASVFCRAADIYLEGFPAGSVTALLEAGEAGLPCVRAPSEVVPPYCTDDPATDHIPQPADAEDYVRMAVSLARDPLSWEAAGRKLRDLVRSCHCGDGWQERLRQIKDQIPRTHSVYPEISPAPVESRLRDWIIRYLNMKGTSPTPATIAESLYVQAWERTADRPRLGWELWRRMAAGNSFQMQQARGEELTVGRRLWDRARLWNLNRRIRRRGTRARWVFNGNLALLNGRRPLARRLAYACLLRTLSSLGDVAWVKVIVKSHLSPTWLRCLKRFCP
jgi:hypothetical protein